MSLTASLLLLWINWTEFPPAPAVMRYPFGLRTFAHVAPFAYISSSQDPFTRKDYRGHQRASVDMSYVIVSVTLEIEAEKVFIY